MEVVKSVAEMHLGMKVYLLVAAAFSSMIHVWYFDSEGSIRFRKSDWGGEGAHGVLNSVQQFIFMACAGLAVFHVVKWLWSPTGPARYPRSPRPDVGDRLG